MLCLRENVIKNNTIKVFSSFFNICLEQFFSHVVFFCSGNKITIALLGFTLFLSYTFLLLTFACVKLSYELLINITSR
jgi:hypothetical protein